MRRDTPASPPQINLHSMDNFAFTHHITITTKTNLLSRSEDDLENELKIVKAISKDSDMNCG